MEDMISIIIPSAKDPHLQKTIDDIRQNALGEVEIVVVLDGTDQYVGGDVVKLLNPKRVGMRDTINRGVLASTGEFIMKCDSHCTFAKGFDLELVKGLEDNMIVVPRRYKLDVEKWEVMDDKPIDYDRLGIAPDKIGGAEWRSRARERRDIMFDETMVFQGSCWIMRRTHWERLGGLQTEGYGTFTQEPVELALKTWLGGGKVMVNKNTWYSHKHRKFKRSVGIDSEETKKGNAYSKDFWVHNRWEDRVHDLDWLMKRFGV